MLLGFDVKFDPAITLATLRGRIGCERAGFTVSDDLNSVGIQTFLYQNLGCRDAGKTNNGRLIIRDVDAIKDISKMRNFLAYGVAVAALGRPQFSSHNEPARFDLLP